MTPNSSKLVKVALVAALGVAAVVGITLYNRPSPAMSHDQVEAIMMDAAQSPSQVAFFGQLGSDFSAEYDQFLAEMAEIASGPDGIAAISGQAGFDAGAGFTQKLRRDNAQYLATAPMADIRKMARASLTLLESLQSNPSICAKFALGGGANLTVEEAEQLDMDMLANVSAANFAGMAAGRTAPVAHTDASEEDVAKAAAMWVALPQVTEGYVQALSSGDPQHPDQCAAQISFQKFLLENDDPVVANVLVRLTTQSMGI